MEKHTPTPWVVWSEEGQTKGGKYLTSICHHIGDYAYPGHKCVAESRGDTSEHSKANAAFIVRACNSHDALVAALEAARRWMARVSDEALDGENCRDQYAADGEKIDAALKAAKEG